MNPRIKSMWADALESGEFKQVVGAMCRREEDGLSHCCLGVLSELYHRDTGGGEWNAHTKALPEPPGTNFSFNGYWTRLPQEVMDWAGLESGNPIIAPQLDGHARIGDDPEGVRTVTANDNLGWSFKQIAEAIRKNL